MRLDNPININNPSTGPILVNGTTSTINPPLSFNDTGTSAAIGGTVAGSYEQVIIQNQSASNGASGNYVVAADNGTATTNYIEVGANSSVFSAATPADFFSLNNGFYVDAITGPLSIGSYSGQNLFFPWGATPNNAHVLNASGALGFSTNLAATVANTGTTGFGSAGMVLVTAGSTAAPAWTANAAVFGTGADGATTINSGTTTLTRDMHYTNLTLSGTGVLNTNGWCVYASGTLDISSAPAGAIIMNGAAGGNASAATGGTFSSASASASGPAGVRSNSGPNGGTGVGTQGTAPTQITTGFGGDGGSGAAGGASGTPNAGGGQLAGVAVVVRLATPYIGQIPTNTAWNVSVSPRAFGASMAGSPGSAGGGDNVNAGGGGGAGGNSAGFVSLRAAVINRGGSTAAGAIQAKGGTGGNGGNGVAGTAGGGGGSGGGAGGIIDILAGTLIGSTATNALDVSGGAGGTGGNGLSTGKGGNGGNQGNSGLTQVLVLSPASFTTNSANAAGQAGSTTATATGAAGGTTTVTRSNL